MPMPIRSQTLGEWRCFAANFQFKIDEFDRQVRADEDISKWRMHRDWGTLYSGLGELKRDISEKRIKNCDDVHRVRTSLDRIYYRFAEFGDDRRGERNLGPNDRPKKNLSGCGYNKRGRELIRVWDDRVLQLETTIIQLYEKQRTRPCSLHAAEKWYTKVEDALKDLKALKAAEHRSIERVIIQEYEDTLEHLGMVCSDLVDDWV